MYDGHLHLSYFDFTLLYFIAAAGVLDAPPSTGHKLAVDFLVPFFGYLIHGK
jgi:hypothetical protein